MSGKPGLADPHWRRLRDLGLCAGCRKDIDGPHWRCFACRKQRADQRRADYHARKAAVERTA